MMHFTIHSHTILGTGSRGVVKLGSFINENHEEVEVACKICKRNKLKKMKFLRTSHKSQGEGRYYTALDELTNEISILKQLNHKNIISLYDIIEDDEENETILVLEYVEIGTMMNYNEDANVFMYNEKLHRFHDSFQWNSDGFVIPNVIQIVNYIQQIAQGLSYLHQQGICHRDIKPTNLLITSHNMVKISDFGCSRYYDKSLNPSALVSDTLGTFAFWAPECIQPAIFASKADIGLNMDDDINLHSINHQKYENSETNEGRNQGNQDNNERIYEYSAYGLDLWAFGITIYAMTFHCLPFYHQNPLELMSLICNQTMDCLSSIDCTNQRTEDHRQLETMLIVLLEGILMKEPSERWLLENILDFCQNILY